MESCDDLASLPSSPKQQQKKQKQRPAVTPVPWRTLIVLCIVLINESVAATMLMPFVGLFVARLRGTSADEAGFVSGFLTGAFQLAQVLCSKSWGRTSDVVGRKPVLMSGLLLSAVALIMFGFSTSVPMAIALRFVHGSVTGNMPVGKVFVSESTDASNEAKGFASISLAYGIGSFIGSTIGGGLFDPCRSTVLPITPSCDGIFGRFPALLPCLAAASYAIFACIVAFFVMPETNVRAKPLRLVATRWLRRRGIIRAPAPHSNRTSAANSAAASPSTTPGASPKSLEHATSVTDLTALEQGQQQQQQHAQGEEEGSGRGLPLVEILRSEPMRAAAMLYLIVCSSDGIWMETFPLWLILSRDAGGMALAAGGVGFVIMLSGFAVIGANLGFPTVTGLFRSRITMYQFCQLTCAAVTFLTPASSFLHATTYAFPVMIALMCVRHLTCAWSYSLSYLIIARSAPREHLGSMYGAAQALGSVVELVLPIVGSALFAISVTGSHVFPFNHFFIFLLGALCCVAGAAYSIGFVLPNYGASNSEGGNDSDDSSGADVVPCSPASGIARMQREERRHPEHDVALPQIVVVVSTSGGAAAAKSDDAGVAQQQREVAAK